MFDLHPIARGLVIGGAALIALGLLLQLVLRVWPEAGRLPGDIVVERGNFTLYIPLGAMLLLSILLTVLLNLLARWWGSR